MPSAPVLFDYLDFRKYLRDFYEFNKKYTPGFSHQMICEEVKLGSRSHFFDIMYGRRLTDKFLPRYVRLLALESKSAEYFRALVHYDQSRTDTQRREAFQILSTLSPNLETLKLDAQFVQLFSEWYQPVLLALLPLHRKERRPEVLCKYFRPRITAHQCEQALVLLQELGLARYGKGGWNLGRKFLTCSATVKELALKPFHRTMQEFGIYHYDHHYDEQVFSTLTINTTQQIKKKIEDLLRDTRSQILAMVKEEPREETVLQVNMQAFSLCGEYSPRRPQ